MLESQPRTTSLHWPNALTGITSKEAKSMPLAEKFFAGAELFESACEISRAGIRRQNPGWDEDRVEDELIRRLREKIEARLSR